MGAFFTIFVPDSQVDSVITFRYLVQINHQSFGAAVKGNLIVHVPDSDEGIYVSTGSYDSVAGLSLQYNIMALTGAEGIELNASDATIKGNFLDQTGARSGVNQPGLEIDGSDNTVVANFVRKSPHYGIRISTHWDDVTESDVTADGNNLYCNVIDRSGRGGIVLPADIKNYGIPDASNTTIDRNLILNTDGEGVAIPECYVYDADTDSNTCDLTLSPGATNTTLTDNTFENNRTDICNNSATTTDGGGNTYSSGGFSTDCVVTAQDTTN